MRRIIFFTLIFIHTGYAIAQTDSENTNDRFKKIEWVLGTWVRDNAKPGMHGTERWVKVSASEFSATGITFSGGDTLSLEKIRIIQKSNDIFYVADVRENPAPVYFKFTGITANEFVCENPAHDFPKKIVYTLNGNNLKVTISGEGKAIDYLFKKDGV